MKTIAILSLLLCTLAIFVSAGKHHNVGRGSCPNFPLPASTTAPTNAPVVTPTDAPSTAPTDAPVTATDAPTTPTDAPTTAPSSSPIEIEVYSASNAWWMAVAVKNAAVDTQSVQIKDSASSWAAMTFDQGWGYWFFNSPSEIAFPMSLSITSVDGETLTLDGVISSFSAGLVETTVQFGSSSGSDPATAPTSRPKQPTTTTTRRSSSNKHSTTTKAATTKAATTKAATTTTQAAATSTTTKAASTSTTTKAASTSTTTTRAASTSTTTKAAATSTTTKASSGSGCSARTKMMVPLYAYPGNDWNTVAASGSVVPTVAIINPNSGPGNGPDSTYNTYMTKLHNAGVEMIGYVHTSYGARSIATVKAEIDVYASKFPLVVGIFLDEASASASQIPYYTELYNYIMSMPGWKYDVLNPGAVAAAGYNSIATQIVSYESTASGFSSSSNPSGASCSNKDLYAVISYSASSASAMQSFVDSAVSKGYYGWVYVTSGTLSGNTYGTLPSYYAQMATYIASKN